MKLHSITHRAIQDLLYAADVDSPATFAAKVNELSSSQQIELIALMQLGRDPSADRFDFPRLVALQNPLVGNVGNYLENERPFICLPGTGFAEWTKMGLEKLGPGAFPIEAAV